MSSRLQPTTWQASEAAASRSAALCRRRWPRPTPAVRALVDQGGSRCSKWPNEAAPGGLKRTDRVPANTSPMGVGEHFERLAVISSSISRIGRTNRLC